MNTAAVTTPSTFRLDVEGGIAQIELSRPDAMNTMTPAFWSELDFSVRHLDQSGTTRALVISSTGKHFTAGMDLSVFAGDFLADRGARGRETLRQKALWLQSVISSLEVARFPVIAAVHGGCIGGGVDLACACDIRYATRDAFFCIQEINIGMMADLGTLQRMPKLVPESIVRELAYTGDRWPATEAYRLGFVNRLFESREEMIAAARETAGKVAAKSPLAIAGSKEAITYARDFPVANALQMIANWQAGMLDAHDVQTAIAQMRTRTNAEFADLPPRPDSV